MLPIFEGYYGKGIVTLFFWISTILPLFIIYMSFLNLDSKVLTRIIIGTIPIAFFIIIYYTTLKNFKEMVISAGFQGAYQFLILTSIPISLMIGTILFFTKIDKIFSKKNVRYWL